MTIALKYSEFVSQQEDGCMLWTGPTCANGRYGRVTGFSKTKMAHRLSYELSFGEIPEGLYVCHTCDVTLCCNPNHLFLGTAKDNMQDCKSKGRLSTNLFKNQSGANNANAKPDLIFRNEDIRKARLEGLSYSQIKEKFNIKSNGHLRAILLSLRFD